MRRATVAVSLLVALTTTRPGAAVDSDWDGDYDLRAERRSDFTAGLSAGVLAASAYGYPNEAGKIDDDRYVADTGVGVGTTQKLWLGGALRDWFTFAIGYWNVGYSGNGLDADGFGVVFRVETFPLWSQGGPWRDAGVHADFGLGGLTLSKGSDERANAGAMSIVALGAFWEPVRFGIFSFGPTVEATHTFSRTLRLYGTSAGARVVLYSGP